MDELRSIAAVARTPLPSRPRLAPWLTHVHLGDGRSQLRGGEFCLPIPHSLFGKMVDELSPFLDGTNSVDEIVGRGAGTFEPVAVRFFLGVLRTHGALQEGSDSPGLSLEDRARFSGVIRHLSHFVPDAELLIERLRSSTVAVTGTSGLRDTVTGALSECAINAAALPDFDPDDVRAGVLESALAGCDLLIAVQYHTGFAFFDAINEYCLRSGVRWMRVGYEGITAMMGPTIVPRQTACFTCYNKRVASHRGHEEWQAFLDSEVERGPTDEGQIHPLHFILAGQVALETVRILTGYAPPVSFARAHAFSASAPGSTGHDVLRLPRCPSCGRRYAPRDPWDERGGPLDSP